MAPHLVRWQNTYGPQGLSVVYADDGRRDSLASARAMAAGVPYQIFHDSRGTAMSSYGIQAYPTAYILDRSGRVVWEGIPVFNAAATEKAIASALSAR